MSIIEPTVPRSLLLAGWLLLQLGSTNAALAVERYPGDHLVIAHTGQSHPDLAPGEALYSIVHPSVGENGNVLYLASLGSSGPWTVWLWEKATLSSRLLVRSGQPVPGAPPSASDSVDKFYAAHLSRDGNRVVFATQRWSASPQWSATWVHTDGTTVLESKVANPGYIGPVTVSDSGSLLKPVQSSASVYSVTRGPSGAGTTIVSQDDQPPGWPVTYEWLLNLNGGSGGNLGSYLTSVDATSTYFLLVANVWENWPYTGNQGHGLYLAGDGAPQRVWHPGDVAPGAPGGHRFGWGPCNGPYEYLGCHAFNSSVASDGVVTFQELPSDSVTCTAGVWTLDGSLTPRVLAGDPIANRPGKTVWPWGGGSGAQEIECVPQRNLQGDIVFIGRVVDGDPGGACSGGWPYALFRLRQGVLEVLAEELQPFEDGSGHAWSTRSYTTNGPILSESGRIYWWHPFDQSGGTDVPWLLEADGRARAVALPGDTLDVGGVPVAIVPIATNGRIARYNRTSPLSNSGYVAYTASYPTNSAVLVLIDPFSATGVAHDPERGSPTFDLVGPSYPNPSPGGAKIALRIPGSGAVVDVRVYDVTGALVNRLARATLPAGRHEVAWNGRDEQGRLVAPGTYFLRTHIGSEVQTRRVSIVR